jgi:hypothetical protein
MPWSAVSSPRQTQHRTLSQLTGLGQEQLMAGRACCSVVSTANSRCPPCPAACAHAGAAVPPILAFISENHDTNRAKGTWLSAQARAISGVGASIQHRLHVGSKPPRSLGGCARLGDPVSMTPSMSGQAYPSSAKVTPAELLRHHARHSGILYQLSNGVSGAGRCPTTGDPLASKPGGISVMTSSVFNLTNQTWSLVAG